MKKKIIIVLAIFLFFVLAGIIFTVGFVNNGIKAVDDKSKEEIIINVDTFGKKLVDKLNDAGLIKNKYACYIYLKLHSDISPQAGFYSLNKSMNFESILDKLSKGDVINDSIQITFVEGKKLSYYVNTISKNFNYTEEEIYSVINDEAYLDELIKKYWFLTEDIKNDRLYYALEGYLYPDTYYFRETASIKDIIEKLLDEMSNKLNDNKKLVEESKYSVHEILTLSSIVELEGGNSNDRNGVAGVFFNRLSSGMSLGSDVTTYYGAKVDMAERDLWQKEIDEDNGYNTRVASMAGKLPIGPICGPSIESIKAVLEPQKHDYLYFVADKNGKTYFNYNYEGHINTINKLKNDGLWYVYK